MKIQNVYVKYLYFYVTEQGSHGSCWWRMDEG